MEQEAEVSKHKKKSPIKFLAVISVLLIAAAGYVGAYYYYNQYKATKVVLDNPEVASQNEVKEITEKLGKIYELPADEEPSVATVLDVEKLKDQPFFSKAANGDKVVIYTKSQIAILFRVNDNKVINVSPLSIEQPTEVSETAEPKAKSTDTPTQEE